MKTKNNKKTLLTVACCAFVAQATNSQAATLMVTSGGVDYTIVEADHLPQAEPQETPPPLAAVSFPLPPQALPQ